MVISSHLISSYVIHPPTHPCVRMASRSKRPILGMDGMVRYVWFACKASRYYGWNLFVI